MAIEMSQYFQVKTIEGQQVDVIYQDMSMASIVNHLNIHILFHFICVDNG